MSSAYERGWGDPGDPNGTVSERERERRWRARNIVRINVKGVTLLVHREVAPLIKSFVEELCSGGYRLDVRADDWGYANRDVRGRPGVKSNHSWGLAVDLNATTNPMTNDGRLHTDLPPNVSRLAAKYGLRWGGDYAKRKDPMHFEFMGTPAEASRRVAQLSHTQQQVEQTKENDPVSPTEIQAVADAVFAKLQPKGGDPLGTELDMLRRDVREIATHLGIKVLSSHSVDGVVES